MEASNNKIQAKDLINVGIFTAIYFVIFFAGMMLGYIPIFIPLLGLVCPILCGIPFMLYLLLLQAPCGAHRSHYRRPQYLPAHFPPW